MVSQLTRWVCIVSLRPGLKKTLQDRYVLDEPLEVRLRAGLGQCLAGVWCRSWIKPFH